MHHKAWADLEGIETRAEQRALIKQPCDADVDCQMAQSDVGAFWRLQNTDLQEFCAVQMANNIQEYPRYAQALLDLGGLNLLLAINVLDAAHAHKIRAKEEVKAGEYVTMLQAANSKGSHASV